MTKDQRIEIGGLWTALAALYGKELSPAVLRLILDSVEDMPHAAVCQALVDWPKTTKLSRHPFPAEIIDAVQPKVVTRDMAIVIARKIDGAIARHGWVWEKGFFHIDGRFWEAVVDGKVQTYGSFRDAAMAELGAIAWHAIQARGGWEEIRNSAGMMDEGQFIAQLRDQVESTIRLAEAGVDITRVALADNRSGPPAVMLE